MTFLSTIRRKKRHAKGFTLVELMMVMSIVALLSSIILTSVAGTRARAREARRQSDMLQFRSALALYDLDNGGYPSCPAPAVCTRSTFQEDTSTVPNLAGYQTLGRALTGNASFSLNGEESSISGNAFSYFSERISSFIDRAHAQSTKSRYFGVMPEDPMATGAQYYYYQTGPTVRTIVDLNGITVPIAEQASVWYRSETRTNTSGGRTAHRRGIVVGTPNCAVFSNSGNVCYPGGLDSIIGASYGAYGSY